MNAIQSQECMGFMMNVKGGTHYPYGEIFVHFLIIYPFRQ